MDHTQVYPRVCGGTGQTRPPTRTNGGLSPRVRGNQDVVTGADAHFRSIPACAGEPVCASPTISLAAVYPRVCGGTASVTVDLGAGVGLSPRVRGNRE